ncbi:iron(III) transport system permease protein [Actinacidiphila yanglinensis]|uniref:Iron(III) transport system permease protein n=1 Tax=Actinacidiphila yanglinensis TaxID=310779 RepID=A0A1H6CHJ6_9ACTN|nr:iron ABC transporter permease [Actinacidiphila yanglinensis]SEG72500.1 iron(III) transport system permease protein [Actinacidiphila yanglinensis]
MSSVTELTGRRTPQASPPQDRPPPATSAKRAGVFLLPVTWAVLAVLVLAPVAYVLVASVLSRPTDLGSGFDFSAIREVFATSHMLTLLGRTIVFALVVAALTTVIGTALAWSTTRLQMRGCRVREVLCIGSLFVAPFVTAVAWIWLATPQTGIMNRYLHDAHVPGWLQPNILTAGGMVFVLVTHFVPYSYLFISAAMRGLDPTLEEASLVNGRNILSTSLRISIPMLRPSILSSALFVAILSMGEFTVPSILGQGGAFQPLSVEVYKALYGDVQDIPLGASISAELLITCMVGLYLYQRTIRSSARYVSVSGRGHRENRIRVRRGTAAVVWVLTIAYGLVAFVLPFVALVLMSLSKYLAPSIGEMHLSFANLWNTIDTSEIRTATIHSLVLAVAVPIICIVIGLAIVYLSDRLHMPTSGAMSYIATAPLALPGLVMGMGILLLFIRTPLYLTLPIIGIGLVSISLTHAVRLISNGFHQIDPTLEEASLVCGASRLRTVRSVLLPLIRPSIFSAFTLIFVLALRELNVAVVLYSPDSNVLSVVAWNYSESALTKAASVGVLQVVVMFVGMGILRLVLNPDRKKES